MVSVKMVTSTFWRMYVKVHWNFNEQLFLNFLALSFRFSPKHLPMRIPFGRKYALNTKFHQWSGFTILENPRQCDMQHFDAKVVLPENISCLEISRHPNWQSLGLRGCGFTYKIVLLISEKTYQHTQLRNTNLVSCTADCLFGDESDLHKIN